MTDKKELTTLEKLSQPLTKDDVEARVGANTKNGFSLLLYKTSRTDVKRLNSVCGLMWSNSHRNDSNGLVCCSISVYDKETNQWITREDVGVESFTEKEKGSYSDSFKRAGFRFGIGIELYNTPFIFVKWDMESDKNKQGKTVYKPKDFYPSNIEIKEYEVKNGEVSKVVITYDGKEIYPKKQPSLTDRFEMAMKLINDCQDENILNSYNQNVNILMADLVKAKKDKECEDLGNLFNQKKNDFLLGSEQQKADIPSKFE